MSIINTIQENKATGQVKDIYHEIKNTWGVIPAPITIMSSSPELLQNQWERYKYFHNQEALSQKLLTIIRLLVSDEAKCEYCIGFNGAILINMFEMKEDEIKLLIKDPSTSPLDNKEKALLMFVLKSIKSKSETNDSDISELKNLGFNDKDILDAVVAGVTMLAGNILFDTFKIDIDY